MLSLHHMHGYNFNTCTALTSSHALIVLHYMNFFTAPTSSNLLAPLPPSPPSCAPLSLTLFLFCWLKEFAHDKDPP